ncbi:hypothetical protein Q0812_13275 [Brevundimonas sp. 2R-24]|uniref:Uncharacterized protein n=1 Tax=Peiella sedimenti TaxID=3061083 RepID=A0ABT8SP92_9CAUL|nr:hypothetical protein [Caulobacteraceae bacterium XZ-24]
MNARRHARLARELIDACGGLDEAAAACRVGKSSLSDYQNACLTAFMPADVIADLEGYCGQAIYSATLAEARPSAPIAGDALTETHEVVQAAAALLPLCTDLLAGKPGAVVRFQEAVSKLNAEVDDVEAIADGNVRSIRSAS